MKNNKKGFTLIELLIVIGIIAILAAAIIIAINPGRQFEQARNATRWSNMNSIANAVYSYVISERGDWPACIPSYPASTTLDSCTSVVEKGHIGTWPSDPSSGEDYMIQFSDEAETRIKVFSTATEATGVEVIQ